MVGSEGVVVEDGPARGRTSLARLERASAVWVGRGDAAPLGRWLGRELDGQGVPRWLGPSMAWDILGRLAEAARERVEDWPAELDARVEGLAGQAVALLRGDGSMVFEPTGPEPGRTELLRFWADRLTDPMLERAAGWLATVRPGGRRGRSSIRLASFAAERGPLAVLRSTASGPGDPGGDLLAIDQLSRPGVCRMELIGGGRDWLGPSWDPGEAMGPIGPSRRTAWTVSTQADLLEWTFRAGPTRIIRTVALLRQSKLALLADEWQGPASEARMRLMLAEGVTASPIPERPGLILERPGGSLRVWPIGLPCVEGANDQGGLTVEGGALQLGRAKPGKRCWLPLVISWDPVRNRRSVFWRILTVSERSRVCPMEVAFAARLAWGSGREGLVFYRSLARPALRAFLGHQTRARMLIGIFTAAGEVVPLVRLD